MMEFNKSRVYTALNADELKEGSIVYVADSLSRLKDNVLEEFEEVILSKVRQDDESYRFEANGYNWNLAYLVSEPEEKQMWCAHTCGNSFVIDNIEADVAYSSSNLNEVQSWCCENDFCKRCDYYRDSKCKVVGYQQSYENSKIYICKNFSPKRESRRVTYREFAEWLANGKGQALYCDITLTDFKYDLGVDSKMVDKDIRVRRWIDNDWHEPTAEYLGIEDKTL